MIDDPDCLDEKNVRDLLLTAIAKLRSLISTANETAEWVKEERAEVRRLVHRLEHPPMRLVCGIILHANGDFQMSGSNTVTLTNVANPAAATRYLAVVDLANGTTLPTASTSDGTKLTAVVGTLTGSSVNIGFYPVDAAAESSDTVTGTISLAGQPDIDLSFVISGTPVPPPETDTLDAASSVGAWAGAPTVPTQPV